MRTAAAEALVALEPQAALALWTDTRRWATFVDGFARVLERGEDWPAERSKVVWETRPDGRGRVSEKVVDRGEAHIRTRVFEERLNGTQTARFENGRLELRLEYELAAGGPLGGLADALFIRRALRDSLRRTAHRFAVEAEEEASLG